MKRMGVFQRREELSSEDFSEHWAEWHARLVSRMTHMRRYQQNHRVSAPVDGFGPDGVAELWWNHRSDMNKDFSDQQFVDDLKSDETNFLSRIAILILEEGELQGRTSPTKIMACLQDVDRQRALALVQDLPQLVGLTTDEVIESQGRDTLPTLPKIPDLMMSFWFEKPVPEDRIGQLFKPLMTQASWADVFNVRTLVVRGS